MPSAFNARHDVLFMHVPCFSPQLLVKRSHAFIPSFLPANRCFKWWDFRWTRSTRTASQCWLRHLNTSYCFTTAIHYCPVAVVAVSHAQLALHGTVSRHVCCMHFPAASLISLFTKGHMPPVLQPALLQPFTLTTSYTATLYTTSYCRPEKLLGGPQAPRKLVKIDTE
jgi:hypothetical protein